MSTACTSSPTERSPPLSASTIRRRVGSARTWKTSATTTYYYRDIYRVNNILAAVADGGRSARGVEADAVALVPERVAQVVGHRLPAVVLAVRAPDGRRGDRHAVQRRAANGCLVRGRGKGEHGACAFRDERVGLRGPSHVAESGRVADGEGVVLGRGSCGADAQVLVAETACRIAGKEELDDVGVVRCGRQGMTDRARGQRDVGARSAVHVEALGAVLRRPVGFDTVDGPAGHRPACDGFRVGSSRPQRLEGNTIGEGSFLEAAVVHAGRRQRREW